MRKLFSKNAKTTPVDDLITAVLIEMQMNGVDSEEYPKLMTYLERLQQVKAKERRAPVSRDTVALIVGNLMGILLIVAYEQKHVMTSKGFTQIIQPNRPKSDHQL